MARNYTNSKGLPSLYNPKDFSPESMDAIFTDRKDILKKLREVLRSFAKTGERRHTLLVGDRGVGKSTLLVKIGREAGEMDALEPLLFTDWNLHDERDLGDVLLRAAKEACRCINNREEIDWPQSFTIDEKLQQAEKIFQENSDTKFVLFAENLQEYFEGVRGAKGYFNGLRAFFENHPNILFIASSTGLPRAFTNYKHPFFAFFDVVNVEPFGEADMIQQLENMAVYYEVEALLDKKGKLKKDVKIKIRAIHHLASGFPRLGVCLFNILAADNPLEVITLFNEVLDVLTPYFEGMETKLSRNERYAFSLIVRTVAPDVVRSTFSVEDTKGIEGDEKDLLRSLLPKLRKKGFISVEKKEGRILIYRVANPLFALWFIKSHIKEAAESGRHILEFVHTYYSRDEFLERFGGLEVAEGIAIPVRAAVESLRGECVQACMDVGVGFVHEGTDEKSLRYFERALKLDPKNAQAWAMKGGVLSTLGRHEEALAALEEALKLNPKDTGAWSKRGFALKALGRHEEALVAFDESLKLDPKHLCPLFGKGDIFVELDRKDEALKVYGRLIEIDPKLAYAWNNKGFVLTDFGRHEEALAAFEEALKIDPKFVTAWNEKGYALADLGRYEEALVAYEEALKIDPKNTQAWNNKGYTLADLGRYEEALATSEEALKIDPKIAPAWNNKGYALADLGRHEEALVAYEEALKIDPKNTPAWNNKGYALKNLGRHEEALVAYEEALKIDPKNTPAWNNKGYALANLGRHEEALAAYDQGIELDPTYVGALVGKGVALGKLGQHEEALAYFDKALKIDPKYAYPWNGKGAVLGDQGRHEEALVAYDKAISLAEGAEDWLTSSAARTNCILTIIEGGLPVYIQQDIKELLETLAKWNAPTQTRVSYLLPVFRLILRKKDAKKALDALDVVRDFDKTLPPKERIAPSFEPVELAAKYLIDGEKALEGAAPILRKEVDMLLKDGKGNE